MITSYLLALLMFVATLTSASILFFKRHRLIVAQRRWVFLSSLAAIVALTGLRALASWPHYDEWFVPAAYFVFDWLAVLLLVTGLVGVLWSLGGRHQSAGVVSTQHIPPPERAVETIYSPYQTASISVGVTGETTGARSVVNSATLNAFRAALSQPAPFVELARHALQRILSFAELTRGALFVRNDATGRLTLACATGLTIEEEGAIEELPAELPLLVDAFLSVDISASSSFNAYSDTDPRRVEFPATLSNVVVAPFVHAGRGVGMALLFCPDAPALTPRQRAVLSVTAEIVAEKLALVKMRGDLLRERRRAESAVDELERWGAVYGRVASATIGAGVLTELCSRCVGILDSTAVALVESVGIGDDVSVTLIATSSNFPELDERFVRALGQGVARGTMTLLSQKRLAEGDSKGESDPSGRQSAALIAPLVATSSESRRQAALFWNATGELRISREDIPRLQGLVDILGLKIASYEQGERRTREGRLVDLVSATLRDESAGMPGAAKERAEKVLASLYSGAPEGSVALLFDNEIAGWRVCAQLGTERQVVADLVILPGEGLIGKCATLSRGAELLGVERLRLAAMEFDMVNREKFGSSFSRLGAFESAYIEPVVVAGRTNFLAVLFLPSDQGGDIARELSFTMSLLGVALTAQSVGVSRFDNTGALSSTTPAKERESLVPGTLIAAEVNEINNDLSIISGGAERLISDQTISDPTRRSLSEILRRSHSLAERLRRGFATADHPSSDKLGEASLSLALEEFSRGMVGGSLYFVDGRAHEVSIEVAQGLTIPLQVGEAAEMCRSLVSWIARGASAEEIVHLSVRDDTEWVAIAVTRRVKGGISGEWGRGHLDDSRETPFIFTRDPARLASEVGDRAVAALEAIAAEIAWDHSRVFPQFVVVRYRRAVLSPTSDTGSRLARRTRLVAVDDQPMIVDLIQSMCQSLDCEVEGFTSPRMALERLRRAPADVLVTDYAMPEINGIELAKLVTADSPRTRVILVTGWGEDIPAERLAQAGIECVIYKPFRLEQITDAIENARRAATA